MRTTISAFLWVAVLALAPACKSDKQEPASNTTTVPTPTTPAPTPKPTPEAPKPAGATLTDPQIAAIVVAANQVDVDAGKLAVDKTKNDEVKKFAQLMITDHSAVNQAAVELVTKLKVTPEETDASRGLVSSGADTRTKLSALDGEAFDRAYVDNEVAYHQAVIGVLDTQLIPSATNEELKKTLVSVRPAFMAHLEHAQQLQKSMTGGDHAHGM
jgi:putative membrane protein